MATTRRANIALWIVQGVFYRFLGFAELCGSLGLVLPGALRIQRALTPIAAVGLTLIVTGATVITLETGLGVAMALMPFVTAMLTATVAYGRRDWLPVTWFAARSSVASSGAHS